MIDICLPLTPAKVLSNIHEPHWSLSLDRLIDLIDPGGDVPMVFGIRNYGYDFLLRRDHNEDAIVLSNRIDVISVAGVRQLMEQFRVLVAREQDRRRRAACGAEGSKLAVYCLSDDLAHYWDFTWNTSLSTTRRFPTLPSRANTSWIYARQTITYLGSLSIASSS